MGTDRITGPAVLGDCFFQAADCLRGSFPRHESQLVVVSLLLVKWFSEHPEARLASPIQVAGLQARERGAPFFVSPEAAWDRLAAQDSSADTVGLLGRAWDALERANDALRGMGSIFSVQGTPDTGDRRARNAALLRAIQVVSQLNFRETAAAAWVGREFEELMEGLASVSAKHTATPHTPREVSRLLAELLDPEDGMSVHDPACGTGGALVACLEYVRTRVGRAGGLALSGQEKNREAWGLCKANMLFHDTVARVELGDGIKEPRFISDGMLMRFDRVVANPPFSSRDWGAELAEEDVWRRFQGGVPPRAYGDLAYLQHALASANATGRVAVVLPQGALFREGVEAEIRQWLITEDVVEAVVALPANLYPSTGIPTVVIVLSREKAETRRRRVTFVDASNEFVRRGSRNVLAEEHIDRIVRAFHGFVDVSAPARIVLLDEIRREDHNLLVDRYVVAANPLVKPDLRSAIALLREAENARDAARQVLEVFLRELEHGN